MLPQPCTKPRGRVPSAQQKDAPSSALPQHSTTARVWLRAYVQRREAEEFIDWQHCRRTRVANTASIERLQQVGNVLIDSSAIAHTRVERKQRRKENRHATTSFCSFPYISKICSACRRTSLVRCQFHSSRAVSFSWTVAHSPDFGLSPQLLSPHAFSMVFK